MISLTSELFANCRRVCTRTGTPSSSRNCLLAVGFAATEAIRVPKPAAGIMTLTFMRANSIYPSALQVVEIQPLARILQPTYAAKSPQQFEERSHSGRRGCNTTDRGFR